MVIYVNEKGVVRSIPSSVPQGTVLRSVVVIAPEGAAETLVLKVFPPSQEKIPDIICKPALDVDGNVVCTASIPAAVTKYAGKAEYQIFAYNKEKEVFPSDRGSFTVTRGVLTDMPDSVQELEKYTIDELYSLLTNVNMVYELLKETQSEFDDLEEIVNTLVTGISQKVDQLKPNDKLTWTYVANHDGTQGYRVLTAEATPDTVMYRDENGRSQVELPSQPKDIANKIYVDGVMEHTRNELEVIAKGATKAIAFLSYSNLVIDLNQADATKYSVGQPFLIGTIDVPDLWVFAVYPEPIPYVYDDDDSIVKDLESKNFISIGYYALAPLETQKVDLTEYAKKTYIDEGLATKMPIPEVSQNTNVPTLEPDGTLGQRSLTDKSEKHTVVYRNEDGRAEIETPENSKDITNKVYVDCTFANALKGAESGAVVAMDDVSPIPHKIPVALSSETLHEDTQVTIKSLGKNLISFPYADGMSKSYNGITFTVNEDRSITVNGTATGDSFFGLQATVDYGENFGAIWVEEATNGKYTVSRGVNYSANGWYNGYVTLYIPSGISHDNEVFYPQLEVGTVATEYEPYKEGETVTTTIAEGAELNSIAPNMTITTDNSGVVLTCSYNKDTNKVIEKLTQAIISLGGNI